MYIIEESMRELIPWKEKRQKKYTLMVSSEPF
jgi:hypothetical protein